MVQANYTVGESQNVVRDRDVERVSHPSWKRRRALATKGSASTLPKGPSTDADASESTEDPRESSPTEGESGWWEPLLVA